MRTDVLDGLASLVDKSLIRQADQDIGEPRLLMLETIREYATERLEQDSEFSAAARRAHATYFADFAQRQWERLSGDGRETALREMESEIENLRIAWRYWVENKRSGSNSTSLSTASGCCMTRAVGITLPSTSRTIC